MKKYLWMLSAAVVIGTLKVKQLSPVPTLKATMKIPVCDNI